MLGLKIKRIIIFIIIFVSNVGIVGIFLNVNRNSNKIGISVMIEIVVFFFSVLINVEKLMFLLDLFFKMKNVIKVIMKVGIVV